MSDIATGRNVMDSPLDAKRGPKGTLGYHHVFHIIVWVL